VRFYLTTPPYPIEVTESLKSSGEAQNAVFGIGADEEFMSSGAPVSGLLRTLLHTYDHPPEDELISSSQPVGGVLVERLHLMDGPLDEVISNSQPVSGVLRDPLIVYDNWPLAALEENVLSSGAPVSGVLT
jgi:hypothetical protein